MDNILSVKDLKIDVISERGVVHAVRGVTFDLRQTEIHGFVGESGCGKTMTAKSILRLHDEEKSLSSGEILYNGMDILSLKKKELREIRGSEIAMIFQDPMQSLNPLLTIGEQITEMLRFHEKLNKKDAYIKAISLLEDVGIKPAKSRFKQYPFEFSGGMLQRIMIAIAISCDPKILIADEPTTALDVTIQAQILQLLKKLNKEKGMTIYIITHNFGVVAEICDRVSVMYAGKIVETGDVGQIFKNPCHPYTKSLLESIPKSGYHGQTLQSIPGSPPQLFEEMTGCPFAPRCSYANKLCYEKEPLAAESEKDHFYTCHYNL